MNRLMIDDAHRALLLVGTLQAHSTPNHQSIQEVPNRVWSVAYTSFHIAACCCAGYASFCSSCARGVAHLSTNICYQWIFTVQWNCQTDMACIRPSNGGQTPCGAASNDKLLCNSWCRYSAGWHFRCGTIFSGRKRHVIFSVSIIPSPIDSFALCFSFVEEPRGVHPHWWRGSAAILGLTEDAYPNAAFGVTPAVLSTIGSVITTSLIRDVFKDDDWQQRWLKSWDDGTWWSEYTLYRLALDIRGLFDKVHVASGSGTFCNPVWYHGDLPWDAAGAFHNENCVFSLVQSTTQLAPSLVAASIGFHVYHPHSSVWIDLHVKHSELIYGRHLFLYAPGQPIANLLDTGLLRAHMGASINDERLQPPS